MMLGKEIFSIFKKWLGICPIAYCCKIAYSHSLKKTFDDLKCGISHLFERTFIIIFWYIILLLICDLWYILCLPINELCVFLLTLWFSLHEFIINLWLVILFLKIQNLWKNPFNLHYLNNTTRVWLTQHTLMIEKHTF